MVSTIPGVIGVTNHSLGRNIGLWVSAFEILVHPETADSGFRQVYELLDEVEWRTQACEKVIYSCYEGRGTKAYPPRNLACWIYGEINHARNDYLHGNPIKQDRLNVPPHGKNLFDYVPSLYRLLLTTCAEVTPLPLPLLRPESVAARYCARQAPKQFGHRN